MIIENGVHDIENFIYHSSEGVSRSGLWEFKKSPFHYHYKYLNPNYVRPEPTPAMIFGELVHTTILEPNEFETRYAIKPNLDRRTKEGKSFYEFFMNTLGKKTAISEDDHKKSLKMAWAFDLTPHAKDLIDGLDMERSIYWTHETTGIQCKVRPDAWKNGLVIDLKTSADAGFRGFQSSAHKYGYYLQAAMIHEALRSLNITMENFVFIVMEKEEPFATGIYTLDNEALQKGIEQFNELMISFAKCKESDNWPGYGIQNLTWPTYAKYDTLLEIEE
jgi:hypothetical protein